MQLVSYIAPAAPATRRPATGREPFVRPEVGFTPRWFRESLGIDFGRTWHADPAYRRETVLAMRAELRKRFPGRNIGGSEAPESPLDLLTGTLGACVIPGIFGLPIVYSCENWPAAGHQYLSDHDADHLEPPDLDETPFFQELMGQLEWIAKSEGKIEGFLNWQGILNTVYRLRGPEIFCDILAEPARFDRLCECVKTTVIDACQRVQARQRESGVEVSFFTVSNCLVNMISPELYAERLLRFDQRIAETFGCIGIHNCAWNATPYLEAYASVPNVGYVDMGIESDLVKAKAFFPVARRAVMLTPMSVSGQPIEELKKTFERIALEYAPCDVVMADIDAGTPDERVRELLELVESVG